MDGKKSLVYMTIALIGFIDCFRNAATQVPGVQCTVTTDKQEVIDIPTNLGSQHTFYCPDCSCSENSTVQHYNHQTGQYGTVETVLQGAEAVININTLNDTGFYRCSCPCNRDPFCYIRVTVPPTEVLWSGSTEAFLHQSYNISCFAAGYPLPNLTVDTSPEQCSYNLNYLTIDLYTRGVTILVGNVTSCWHTALLHCYVSDPGAQSVQGIIRLNVKDQPSSSSSSSTVMPIPTGSTSTVTPTPTTKASGGGTRTFSDTIFVFTLSLLLSMLTY